MGRQVYWAGELFDHKHLAGNYLLAQAVEKVSDGRWTPILPQDSELPEHRALAIRNHDFELLLEAQAAVFNFEGTELDSGTVVEFMVAKMIDLPSVLLRTDFRHAGDQEPGGDPWNLMCSGYPRTLNLPLNAMQVYQEFRPQSGDGLTALYRELGSRVTEQLDAVWNLPPVWSSKEELAAAYRQAIRTVGGGMEKIFSESRIAEAVARRV